MGQSTLRRMFNNMSSSFSSGTSSDMDVDKLSARCKDAVSKMKETNINFLAIDFDQTIIDIHTGGQWKGTASELIPHVRPLFRHLMIEANNANIHMAVVTFSPQVRFIREVLESTFPQFADRIVIRGRDRTWSYEGLGIKDGKQGHMASAVEELQLRTFSGSGDNYNTTSSSSTPSSNDPTTDASTEIKKNTTLLIDDDANNIYIALHDGVRAIWLNPDRPYKLLDDLQNLV